MGRHTAKLSIYLSLGLLLGLPAPIFAECEGIEGPAQFFLHKNGNATFHSYVDADYPQRYKVEWFVGSRSLGSITKNGGESFVLKGSGQSSRVFSVTGFYEMGHQWLVSYYKIYPDRSGGIQVRFEDGACDNSFESSPDLKVIINID